MGYAYSNNGLSFRTWNAPEDLLEGEVYFNDLPNDVALLAAFPGYTAAKNAATGRASFRLVNNAGCQIVSTGTPDISGTYGITAQDEINIVALQIGIDHGATWLGGYRDSSGIKHTMTEEP